MSMIKKVYHNAKAGRSASKKGNKGRMKDNEANDIELEAIIDKNYVESASHHKCMTFGAGGLHLKHFWLPSEDGGAKHSPILGAMQAERTSKHTHMETTSVRRVKEQRQ